MSARPGASPVPQIRPWQEWVRDSLRPNELEELKSDDFQLPASSRLAPLIAGLPPRDMRLPLALHPFNAAALRRFELGSSGKAQTPSLEPLATRLAAFDRGRFSEFVEVVKSSKSDRILQLAKLVHEKRRDFISDPAGLTGRVLANQLVNHISQLENYRTLTGEDTELDALLAELIEALQGHAQRLEKRKRKREP